jgi:eukaryotic-like serine/threonine-protein kinase
MSMIGKTLGNFEITGSLGKGGMGEVYRAHDAKLNRDVALKVLPSQFANDAERMGRLKREAQLLVSLNHTNIAAIYGLEESGGVCALIMELAEGPTLAERILKGPTSLDEALCIARQIAEALEAAHEKGIIHLDLKPANIKITPEGAVKVLGFGLAKAFEEEAPDLEAWEGVFLGTPAYMAPERARGSGADKRCDIWSFGVVLFEMLAGKQLFASETVCNTFVAVLRADVNWKLLPANTPASIRMLLRRCLIKDRNQRLRDIGDARIIIEDYISNPSEALVLETAAVAGGHKLRERLTWGIVIILVAALAVLGVVYYRKISEPRQITRFEYTLPEDQQFSTGGEPFLAISPDGRQFAFTTNKGLFVRSLDKWDAQCIVEPNGNPSNPFFSHDGKWVGYSSALENKLKKVSVKGGAPIALCDVRAFSRAHWTADDAIIYGEYGKGLMRISANGGNPEVLFKPDDPYFYHPRLLPDGKSLRFTISPYPYSILTRLTGSPEGKIIIPQGDRAFYLPTGHLVYGLENKLYAVSFDPSKLTTSGASIPIVEGVFRTNVNGAPQYDVSPSSTLIYASTTAVDAAPKRTLVWVNRVGMEEPLNIPPNHYGEDSSSPKISPDGTRVALTINTGGNMDIWIWDLVRKKLTRLTDDLGEDGWPLWTPDSQRIIYRSSNDGMHYAINRKATDGSGEVEKLGSPPNFPGPFCFIRDGKALLLWEGSLSPQQTDIVMLSIEGGFARKPLLSDGSYFEQHPQISPDGRWLAYASNESGQNEAYVVPFPEVKRSKFMVSINGGNGPLWSPDGREIFYRNGDSVMAVAVETDPIFKPGLPKMLFKGKYYSKNWGSAILSMWDINPKDKRFLMMKEEASKASAATGPRKINVVLNWFEELKQRVPAK